MIEDCPMYRRALERVLARAGFVVDLAQDMSEALERLRAETAAVTLDYRMPGHQGDEILVELLSRRPNLPVVFVSGSLTPPLTQLLMERGARACVDKLHVSQQLVATLREVLTLASEQSLQAPNAC
ncbi:MAG: response regulator [Proteobacteria bacterium]|nr:response regulator [Pseudomonadota bacterium]